MKNLLLGLLVFGFTTQIALSQVEVLPEVELDLNYKYLNAIDSKDVAIVVKNLENKVSLFNLIDSEFYDKMHKTYVVRFHIPEGRILAVYDSNGKVLKTIERFKNIKLPISVANTVKEVYPKWTIIRDAYEVDYYSSTEIARKEYKLKLKNNNQEMTIRVDDLGEIL